MRVTKDFSNTISPPYCQARSLMHWDDKIPLNCPPQEKLPSYMAIFSLQKG